jgi:hypothetical protein
MVQVGSVIFGLGQCWPLDDRPWLDHVVYVKMNQSLHDQG